MKAWGAVCWISLGGLIDTLFAASGRHSVWPWVILIVAAGSAWGWSAALTAFGSARRFVTARVTGQAVPLPATDPQALAAEVAALNAQIAQLRDTATSFDVSFDQTLHRLDERLRRIEQQTSYVQVGQRLTP